MPVRLAAVVATSPGGLRSNTRCDRVLEAQTSVAGTPVTRFRQATRPTAFAEFVTCLLKVTAGASTLV